MKIKEINGQKGVFATQEYKQDEVVHRLDGPILDEPTQTSIQIGKNMYIEDKFGKYMNHTSIFPNIYIKGPMVFALVDIENGDELRFDYTDNEDFIAHPFIDESSGQWVGIPIQK